MKATAYVYRPGIRRPETTELDHQPDLEWYKTKLDGGWIELVPGFDKIRIEEGGLGDAPWRRCVAFCDEEGKLKQLPINEAATRFWHDVVSPMWRQDVLVGPVIVLVGDTEFMEEL